ncbi:unnamed protein product, partial [Adineta steineri]
MLAHPAQHRGRYPIGYGGGGSPIEYKWKVLWPYVASTIIGSLIILCGLLLFVLEIASLALIGKYFINTGIWASGVGIWAGIFIMAAGVFILILNWMKSVRLWAFIALCVTIAATAFAIIDFGINAARVNDASVLGLFNSIFSDIKSIAGLAAAQLTFGILAFLLCAAFIGLYIYIVFYQCNNQAVQQFVTQLSTPTDSSANCASTSNTGLSSHIITCTVQISIDNQPINVILLSSSGAFWIASNECNGSACPNTSTYDSDQFNNTSISYNTDNVHGTVASGTFGGSTVLGGVTAVQQPFGLITSIDNPPKLESGPSYNGILGFTYTTDSFVNGLAPLMVTLNQQGKLQACGIAFTFVSQSDTPLTGYSTLNKPDPITYIPNTFSYTPTLFPGYWLFNVENLAVNKFITIDKSFPALLAPFVAFIYGPSSEIYSLNQKLGCSKWSQGICFIDCSQVLTLPNITFTIQAHDYTLYPIDYILFVSSNVCLSAFVPDPLNSMTPDNQSIYWTLGNPFVAKYVSHFDCQNNSVGLATKNPLFK